MNDLHIHPHYFNHIYGRSFVPAPHARYGNWLEDSHIGSPVHHRLYAHILRRNRASGAPLRTVSDRSGTTHYDTNTHHLQHIQKQKRLVNRGFRLSDHRRKHL